MPLKFANQNKLLKTNQNKIWDFYLPNPSCMNGKKDICKGATALCMKYCYGNCVFRHSNDPNKKKLTVEEQAWENYRISKTKRFVSEMNELINKTLGIEYLRIHSIGDFYNYEYFLKWIEIIKSHSEVQFVAYVKNFSVLEQFMKERKKVPRNFNILLSFFPDTYDKYKEKGGQEYVDNLLDKLKTYYNAKIYKVCSKEFFKSTIKNSQKGMYFCNGGTEKLFEKSIQKKDYKKLIKPNQGCEECMKCYSNEKCPSGSTIHAILRAPGSLANLETFLKKQPITNYEYLRKMYPKET